jgi:hypothetical protein
MVAVRTFLVALAVLGAPRLALACPVCFGRSDSPMAVGTNMAVFFMLGVTGSVLAGFASFIFYLVRRAHLVAADGADPAARHSQEGTAQC